MFSITIVAVPLSKVTVFSLPSIITVTSPVAFSIVTFTLVFSPALISLGASIVTLASCFCFAGSSATSNM